MNITIYTDGACSGNPGIGGWGAVILQKNENPVYINGGQLHTTNNQMELIAAIKALKYINDSSSVKICTDSKYVKVGIESWIINWKENGWKTSAKKPVKNKNLWMELDKQIHKHIINWQWVKGHDGHQYNEKADYLARKFIKEHT